MKVQKTALFLMMLMAVIAAGCSDGALPTGRHPAEETVEKMYAAMSAGDTDAYMDKILPENRRRPNLFGLLEGLTIYIGPTAFDLGQVAGFTFHEVQVSLMTEMDDYALVKAEGLVRYQSLMWEVPFCDQHDVRRLGDEWYVDIYATDRMERISEIRLQQLENPALWTNLSSGSDLVGLLDRVAQTMELALDQCES